MASARQGIAFCLAKILRMLSDQIYRSRTLWLGTGIASHFPQLSTQGHCMRFQVDHGRAAVHSQCGEGAIDGHRQQIGIQHRRQPRWGRGSSGGSQRRRRERSRAEQGRP